MLLIIIIIKIIWLIYIAPHSTMLFCGAVHKMSRCDRGKWIGQPLKIKKMQSWKDES